MIHGVVIWYSRQEFKALIWCEDSGGLAIATGATSWRNPIGEVAVGDYVAFTPIACGRERKCRDIHLIAPQVAPDLPQAIMGRARPATSETATTPPERRKGNPLLHLCASRD